MNLAFLAKIIAIESIENADRIVKATVDCGDSGMWPGVVAINTFSVGDVAVVFLQDALLPPNDRWAFMKEKNWRVRMARFRGCPSECVIVQPTEEELQWRSGDVTDISARLGVVKYEKPVPAAMAGEMAGAFPTFIPKTDEPNFQTCWKEVNRIGTDPCTATLKADGTSCTAWVAPNDKGENELHVCSRNWELREFTATGARSVYWEAARQYDLTRLPPGYALQFEVVGPGVQENRMKLAQKEMRAFKIYDIANRRYLPRQAFEETCRALNLPMAEVLPFEQKAYTGDELRAYAETLFYAKDAPAEGVVIAADDGSWSFKVLNLQYRD